MAVNACGKFLLLIWKNWLIEKHHKIQLLFEITLPTIFISLLVFARSQSKPIEFSEPTVYQPDTLDDNLVHLRNLTKDPFAFILAYSPRTEFTESLMQDVGLNLNVTTIGLKNSAQLEEFLKINDIIAGIAFNDSYVTVKTNPKHLTYELRFPSELRLLKVSHWQTNHLYRPESDKDLGPTIRINPSYINEGFLAIQHSIAQSFIGLNLPYNDKLQRLPKIELQKFPYPPYKKDTMLTIIDSLLSIFLMMSYSFIFICAVKYVTDEKEKKLKEFMKIMGLENWLHWSSWFIKTFIVYEIATVLLISALKFRTYDNPSVLYYSDWTVVLFLFTIYGFATITFSFMMSTLFSKANTAATISGILWYSSYTPFFFLKDHYDTMCLSVKILISIFSNSALGNAIKLTIDFEAVGKGLQWNNMWSSPTTNDDLCIGYIILMLILDTFLYMISTLYLEKLFPGEYGIPKKWYFPFTTQFWCKSLSQYSNKMDSDRETPFDEQDPEAFESQPMYRKVGIKVKGLRKVFDDERVAVKELFMNMYEDEITALLGHNGAGKSTTMSMLTGLISPTSGTAIINGHDIRKSISTIRKSLGLCPQRDILFDDLTVKEHLIFYTKLKGFDGKHAEIDVNKYLRILELEDKANEPSRKLSGGMKRRLSVAISLCGDPRVILMDEPTAGMDPSARRTVWNLLQREKMGKTILLSTHFMNEADILGDRIAILCEGELKCYGTSFFLKKKFGNGYHLICIKAEGCNTQNVTQLIQRYIPKIKVAQDIGNELFYELSDQYAGVFEMMLSELEASSNKLGLSGYGISLTTLEEVFMKIGKMSNLNKTENNNCESSNDEDVEAAMIPTFDAITDHGPLEEGYTLMKNRLKAMFFKKLIYTIRNWTHYIFQIFIPLLWIGLILINIYAYQDDIELPPLPITLNKYSDAAVILEVTKNVKKYTIEWNIADQYTEFLLNDTTRSYELISINEDFQNYFLDIARNDLLAIKYKYLVAATINANKITAWYNNEMLHSAPLTLHIVHNALVRACLGPSYKIELTNHPQPFKPETEIDESSFFFIGMLLSVYMAIGMSFITCFFVILPIQERLSGAKLLQFVAGIKAPFYWMSAYLWDFITFIFIAIIYLIIVALFQQEGFSTFEELGKIFLVFIFFVNAAIPFTYAISQLLNDSSTAFTRMWILAVLPGPVLYCMVYFINIIESKQSSIGWLFRLIPYYSLTEALVNLSEVSIRKKICSEGISCENNERCCNLSFMSWTYPGIIPNLVYLIFMAGLMLLLIIMHDTGYMDNFYRRIHDYIWRPIKPPIDNTNMDDDVKNEKDKIKSLTMREIVTFNVVLDRVTKFYRKSLAVNEISVAITNNECFGLLGVNGAGKTTTFKMMTGEEMISSGEIYLKGNNVQNRYSEVHQETGYCPQSDALLNDFTGRELLRMFSLIRGVPSSKIERLCLKLAKDLDFMKYLDKRIKSYSGGTKRKLNTAIALIGSPSIIFLDEPSAGMDPSARRQLWNMIIKVRDSGRTIILTSHSMEECEALCTRLAIMVNGDFKCLGSTQHLKNKFSKGIILKIKLKNRRDQPSTSRGHMIVELVNGKLSTQIGIERLQSVPEEYPMMSADVENILRFVGTHFWGANLSENYEGMLTFHIPLANIRWSKIFGLLENNRELLNIEDYSISQTTLEQIFLDFANQQRSE